MARASLRRLRCRLLRARDAGAIGMAPCSRGGWAKATAVDRNPPDGVEWVFAPGGAEYVGPGFDDDRPSCGLCRESLSWAEWGSCRDQGMVAPYAHESCLPLASSIDNTAASPHTRDPRRDTLRCGVCGEGFSPGYIRLFREQRRIPPSTHDECRDRSDAELENNRALLAMFESEHGTDSLRLLELLRQREPARFKKALKSLERPGGAPMSPMLCVNGGDCRRESASFRDSNTHRDSTGRHRQLATLSPTARALPGECSS